MSGAEPGGEVTASAGGDRGARRRAGRAGLRPGDVVLVRGEMGAGKTTFVRGACRALGVTGPVTSPTFTIGRRYDGAAACRSPTSTSTASPTSTTRTRRCSPTTSRPTRSRSSSGRRSASAGSRRARDRRARAPRHAGGDRRRIEIDPVTACAILGFDTATPATVGRRCRARGRARRAPPRPGARRAARPRRAAAARWPRRRSPRPGCGWGDLDADRRRRRARDVHRPADRRRHGARARAGPAAPSWSASRRSARSPRRAGGRAAPSSRCSTPAAARRSSPPGAPASAVAEPGALAPEALAEREAGAARRHPGWPWVTGRYDSASSSRRRASRSRRTARPLHRVGAGRALPARGRGAAPVDRDALVPEYVRAPDAERRARATAVTADASTIRRLTYADLPQVIAIERRAFPTPWSLAMFVLELSKPAGVCLAARRDGRAGRLPDLLALRHGLARHEHRGRPRQRRRGHRHRAARPSCWPASATDARFTLEVRPPTPPRSSSTSTSASARRACAAATTRTTARTPDHVADAGDAAGTLDDVPAAGRVAPA